MQLTPQETKQLREEWSKDIYVVGRNNATMIKYTDAISSWWISRINALLEEKERGLIEKVIEDRTRVNGSKEDYISIVNAVKIIRNN